MTDTKPLFDPSPGPSNPDPPDRAQRSRALDPTRSFLVQAPAGSGKTYLLTQRFLRLLAQVEKPEEIVAITFTRAAAAEMRSRVLEALEVAERNPAFDADPESLPALAARALDHARRLDWKILDQPSQLRITTIDAFCRGLALQSPLSWGGLLSGLGGRLDPVDNPGQLYRRAATQTLALLKGGDSPARLAVEAILRWRDNNWKDLEDLIVEMLGVRNRWYQEFVFASNNDWDALRYRLEAPFRRAARASVDAVCKILDRLPESREYALSLARFACEAPGKSSPLSLAERAEFPSLCAAGDGSGEADTLQEAIDAYRDLACFLLTKEGEWRKKGGLNAITGFPATPGGRALKDSFETFVQALAQEPALQAALRALQAPTPVRYTEEEWALIRHCFAVLRHAAGQLQLVFAETGSVDFTEVAQIALRILAPENGIPSDFALRTADSIRHLLIDEFQDTSRSQHQLLSRLIAAWPEREGRSCFCVGDPMQSIYGFRESEVELFERARTHGLEAVSGPDASPLCFDFVRLSANFRTVPSLIDDLNLHFDRIFAEDDGSGVSFSPARAARASLSQARTELHLAFTLAPRCDPARLAALAALAAADPIATRNAQLQKIVALIQAKSKAVHRSRQAAKILPATPSEKYRVAVLGRTAKSLIPIAEALREAGIACRAIDLVPLRQRPEVLDALSLTRALLNPTDRTAWLGVLRAPWCGLSLQQLHLLTSADDPQLAALPIPELLRSRLPALFNQGLFDLRAFEAASRVSRVLHAAIEARAAGGSFLGELGTWLESVWKALGGADTVNPAQMENLRMLWSVIDRLPNGELDLLGPALNEALDKLCAAPDPPTNDDFEVQLMTIHKSKGLEFELVIVPDLEAQTSKGERKMISWLERGLASPASGGESDSLTEFLIAPIQPKGSKSGEAKRFVDAVKLKRESQEMRRLLYVAATRAREELHLFSRPRVSVSQASGEIKLANRTGLLATAWPAFGDRVDAEFAAWLTTVTAAQQTSAAAQMLPSLAAQAGTPSPAGNLLQMPAPPARPTLLRRLPQGYIAPGFPRWSPSSATSPVGADPSESSAAQLYTRSEGGLQSRLLGTAIHALLEHSSRLRRGMDPHAASHALAASLPAITARIRSAGLPRPQAERLANEALAVARQAAIHPVGAWILAPHPEAETESRWTGLVYTDPIETGLDETGLDQAGLDQTGLDQTVQPQLPFSSPEKKRLSNLRPDRLFFASPDPSIESIQLTEGAPAATALDKPSTWWIIDYKTTPAAGVDLQNPSALAGFLAAQRQQHRPQLASYAQLLRGLRGQTGSSPIRIRAGIFYPRLQIFDHWDA